MKKILILVALIATMVQADISCMNYGGGMTVCTDDATGKQTTIWNY